MSLIFLLLTLVQIDDPLPEVIKQATRSCGHYVNFTVLQFFFLLLIVNTAKD